MSRIDVYCWRLGEALKASGVSRAELARRLGVKPATLKSWVTGRRSPSIRRLLALTAVLGLDVRVLFDDAVELPDAAVCPVCGQRFARPIGLRIHVSLRAKTCEEHARLEPAGRRSPLEDVEDAA